ncbi:MAG: glycogen-binding domain-containing protein [Lentisphaeria bacterium]|nr:glycogen-binding domain-containing protein [Lentisphaeria bacterium]
MACSKKINAKRRITFLYHGHPGDKVFLAGDFNDWKTDAKELQDKNNDGTYACICMLPPGKYLYKFFVNGIWVLDASNPNLAPNGFGSHNSILEIGK